YADYYREQFRLLLANHGGEIEVGTSAQPVPIHFSFAEHDHVEGQMSAARRAFMRDVFDLPDLEAMDDGIANGTHTPGPGEPHPLSLFTAPRVDYSLQRMRHYTGTSPDWFQNFVLFTNYQFYVDEFIKLGHAEMAKADSPYVAFIEPGNVVTRRAGLPHVPGDELGHAPPRRRAHPARPSRRAARPAARGGPRPGPPRGRRRAPPARPPRGPPPPPPPRPAPPRRRHTPRPAPPRAAPVPDSARHRHTAPK